MKGQYRIISELILFGLGILITSYVIINFNGIQDNLRGVTAYDQMNAVADSITNSIAKLANTENSTIYVEIPDKISGTPYRIQLNSINGGKLVISTVDTKTVVERQLFNINYDNKQIANGVVNDSEVLSSAGFIQIVKNSKITVVRT